MINKGSFKTNLSSLFIIILIFAILSSLASACLNPQQIQGQCTDCNGGQVLLQGWCFRKMRGCLKYDLSAQKQLMCLECQNGYLVYEQKCEREAVVLAKNGGDVDNTPPPVAIYKKPTLKSGEVQKSKQEQQKFKQEEQNRVQKKKQLPIFPRINLSQNGQKIQQYLVKQLDSGIKNFIMKQNPELENIDLVDTLKFSNTISEYIFQDGTRILLQNDKATNDIRFLGSTRNNYQASLYQQIKQNQNLNINSVTLSVNFVIKSKNGQQKLQQINLQERSGNLKWILGTQNNQACQLPNIQKEFSLGNQQIKTYLTKAYRKFLDSSAVVNVAEKIKSVLAYYVQGSRQNQIKFDIYYDANGKELATIIYNIEDDSIQVKGYYIEGVNILKYTSQALNQESEKKENKQINEQNETTNQRNSTAQTTKKTEQVGKTENRQTQPKNAQSEQPEKVQQTKSTVTKQQIKDTDDKAKRTNVTTTTTNNGQNSTNPVTKVQQSEKKNTPKQQENNKNITKPKKQSEKNENHAQSQGKQNSIPKESQNTTNAKNITTNMTNQKSSDNTEEKDSSIVNSSKPSPTPSPQSKPENVSKPAQTSNINSPVPPPKEQPMPQRTQKDIFSYLLQQPFFRQKRTTDYKLLSFNTIPKLSGYFVQMLMPQGLKQIFVKDDNGLNLQEQSYETISEKTCTDLSIQDSIVGNLDKYLRSKYTQLQQCPLLNTQYKIKELANNYRFLYSNPLGRQLEFLIQQQRQTGRLALKKSILLNDGYVFSSQEQRNCDFKLENLLSKQYLNSQDSISAKIQNISDKYFNVFRTVYDKYSRYLTNGIVESIMKNGTHLKTYISTDQNTYQYTQLLDKGIKQLTRDDYRMKIIDQKPVKKQNLDNIMPPGFQERYVVSQEKNKQDFDLGEVLKNQVIEKYRYYLSQYLEWTKIQKVPISNTNQSTYTFVFKCKFGYLKINIIVNDVTKKAETFGPMGIIKNWKEPTIAKEDLRQCKTGYILDRAQNQCNVEVKNCLKQIGKICIICSNDSILSYDRKQCIRDCQRSME